MNLSAIEPPKHSNLYSAIDHVPDFPMPGIMFYDISRVLSTRMEDAISEMVALYSKEEWDSIDLIGSIDARGFIFASALAMHTDKNIVMIRKAGKLPPPLVSYKYDLEYGTDTLEMRHGNGNVLLADDVLATGGTLKAAAELCKKSGYHVNGFATFIDLRFLNNFTWQGLQCRSVLQYEE